MDIKLILLLLVILHVGCFSKRLSDSGTRPRTLYLRAQYGKACEDNPPDTHLDNVTIAHDGNKVIVSGSGILSRPIKLIEKAIVIIRTCHDSAEDQNCELFQTWRFGKESCSMMVQKHMIWSPLFEAMTPEVKCPVAKGAYKVTNATFDAEPYQRLFRSFPFQKYFWRARVEGYDHKKFACVEFGFYFVSGRQKN